MYFDASNTTNRILDVLQERRSKIICIDELDKMPRTFQNQLLNFMESGRIKVVALPYCRLAIVPNLEPDICACCAYAIDIHDIMIITTAIMIGGLVMNICLLLGVTKKCITGYTCVDITLVAQTYFTSECCLVCYEKYYNRLFTIP